jgi:HD-like signal output (HDOD) protein
MKTRILFVDDELNTLDGLRRLLRSQRKEWEMSFVSGGQEAMDLVATQPFDAVVTDMRMPGMDGPQLLMKLAIDYPGIARFVLSGSSDDDMIMKSVGTAHQCLLKPCDSNLLKAALTRTLSLRKRLKDERLMALVSGVSSLHSLPEVYLEILEAVKSDNTSVRSVGEIIEKDPAITAKVLQLVNAAFFGLGRKISKPTDAASLLGLDVLKTLVLSVGIFSQFDQRKISVTNFSIKQVFDHCIAVGTFGKRIASNESVDQNLLSESLLAGTLHELGKLLLVTEYPEDYAKICGLMESEKLYEYQAEKEILGATISDLTAYLLALWGFSDSVVEAVAFHHQPGLSSYREFTPLTAVHVADVLVYKGAEQDGKTQCTSLDRDYLETSGLAGQVESWKELYKDYADKNICAAG